MANDPDGESIFDTRSPTFQLLSEIQKGVTQTQSDMRTLGTDHARLGVQQAELAREFHGQVEVNRTLQNTLDHLTTTTESIRSEMKSISDLVCETPTRPGLSSRVAVIDEWLRDLRTEFDAHIAGSEARRAEYARRHHEMKVAILGAGVALTAAVIGAAAAIYNAR